MELLRLLRLSHCRRGLPATTACLLLLLGVYAGASQAQQTTVGQEPLVLQSDDSQRIMPAKNYASTRYSGLDQIDIDNV